MAGNNQPIIIIKKKGGSHGGHHGGAWKVAYADFVTAMMAFFLVMWLMGSDEEVKASIEGYFNNPASTSPVSLNFAAVKGGEQLRAFEDRRPAGGRPMDMPAGKINAATTNDADLIEMKELLEETIALELGMTSISDQLQMTYDSNGLVLRIAVKDFFAHGSVEIREDLLPVIYRIAQVLTRTKKLIRVEGHTDKTEENSPGYNSGWELSTARAAWVAQYWRRAVPKLSAPRLQVAGNSYYRPVAESDTEAGRASNRRVEIIILNTEFRE